MSESTNSNSNNDDKQNSSNENQPTTYYERRKNLISGVDNSHLAIGIASFGALAGVTALLFPEQIQRLKENVVSLFQKKPAELPAPPAVQPEYVEEPYIPPTPPQQNHQVIPQQQQLQQQQTIEEPVQEEKQQQEEELEPEIFYDDELAKREKRLFGKSRRIDKYDSPFGAGIANS